MLASPKDCRALLDRVPGLGLIFDTGNFRVDDPGSDELAAYESLKDRMIRVHVKDVVLGNFESGETCIDGQKIRVFGVSNWTHQRIKEANRYAADYGLEVLSVSSHNFGLLVFKCFIYLCLLSYK